MFSNSDMQHFMAVSYQFINNDVNNIRSYAFTV